MNQSGKEFESQMTNRNEQYKIEFSGIILSVQPRSNVWRYRLDNRTHSMNGYNIFLSGIAEGDERDFAIAISEKQQQKLRFHIGDEIRGTAWTKMYSVGAAECLTADRGKPIAFNASGRAWRMWRLNTTGV